MGSHRPPEPIKRRGSAGRPPRPRTETITPADPSPADPLFGPTGDLPTHNNGARLMAHEVPRQGRGSAGTVYQPSREVDPPGRAQVRREVRESMPRRGWRRPAKLAALLVLTLATAAIAGFAAWLAFLAWFHAEDERLTPMSSVSPVLALAAACLLLVVLAMALLLGALRLLGRGR